MTLEIGICEDVSMQDYGYFFDRFEDICQHALRKRVENGSKALRGLMKGFEDGRKLAQLSCCRLQLCARLSSAFEGFLSMGEL